MSERRTFRCAIYTRKSTEEGLDQDFNSLQAQREACEAYVRSQAHEGWKGIPTAYDDGGYSGGTMDRPGLAALLGDIKEHRVDVVVVYKIDRLTRSLADFARIVEILDASGASFVSVTQAFSTTTSMGRLTLNVLLSFAQFEREVTAERIRDKIAASKRKGMWMGGRVPLGYDLQDGRLIVNESEADVVRTLFRLCLEIGSVRLLKDKADELGLRTKLRREASGRVVGGRPFSRGHLYALLANPIYIGRTPHRGQSYPGQHPPIIDAETWSAVRRLLAEGTPSKSRSGPPGEPSLLAGLVFDETGDRLAPTHAVKQGRRYRYYVSQRLLRAPRRTSDGWRLPAQELEGVVVNLVGEVLGDIGWLVSELHLDALRPDQLQMALGKAEATSKDLQTDPLRRRDLLSSFVERIVLEASLVRVTFRGGALRQLLSPERSAAPSLGPLVREWRLTLRRRGFEAKLVIEGARREDEGRQDPKLIGLLAQAHRALRLLTTGSAGSIQAVATKIGQHPSDVTRILPLAFLAPNIVVGITSGVQPVSLTAQRLKRLTDLPEDWRLQRALIHDNKRPSELTKRTPDARLMSGSEPE
ncbi:MAG: recombinase family protein [Bauldia sp.]|nr:recombinase family protein [Bauldia sp.]